MTRSELVQRIAKKNPHLFRSDIEKIVSIVFERISCALEKGQRVELRGFGAFNVKKRNPRISRNPRTGQRVQVDGKAVPTFKMGKELIERINSKDNPK